MTRDLLRHPRGLGILFGTEMWERMSYYGMRALLVGYLTRYLLLPGHVEHVMFYAPIKSFYEMMAGPLAVQPFSSLLYGTYTGLIYATPLLGGWLADNYLGQRATAVTGMVLMAFGHFMMAVEALLFPALLLLIVGGGLFKTNTSSQVGLLYPAGDSRRDRGYAIFYVGINLGGFIAPFVCGTLGEEAGWHWGFGAAGMGMLLALAVYFVGWKYLPPDSGHNLRGPRQRLTSDDWKAVGALLLLVIPLTLYWACNEQQGNTGALWSMNNTDRVINLPGWHFEIDWTWFQSINPLVILVGTPLILAFWRRQGAGEPSPTMKMAIGCWLMVAANLLMAFAAWRGGGHAHWSWLMAYFVILTVGEIYLYPVGLSLYSKIAPVSAASLIMGIYFLPNFLGGGFLQGWLGTFWDKMDKALFFAMIAAVSAVAGLIIWAFDRPLKPFLEEKMHV